MGAATLTETAEIESKPKSRIENQQGSESFIFHRSQRDQPTNIVSGSGISFTTNDGQHIIDASAGPSVAILGHNQPRVMNAVLRQMQSISYAYSMGYTTTAGEELARLLLEDQPGGLSRAIFVNSGSEATDAALKLASQYWIERGQPRKTNFIARKQSYHGNTLGALCVSGHESRREMYQSWMSTNVSFVDPCYTYRAQVSTETEEEYVDRLAVQFEQEIMRLGADTVAAFIMEPVSGTTLGCVPPAKGYMQSIRRICDRHDILLIYDEIMCGIGKTGAMHAWEQEGASPDIQTIGKALGAGFVPISGVLAKQKVYDSVANGSKTLAHGHTFQAHPIACAAALEVQRIIREEDLLSNVAIRGEQLQQELHKHLSGLPHVGDIRGRGLFMAVEFMKEPSSRTPFPLGCGYSDDIVRVAKQAGLNILGTLGHTGEHHVEHVIVCPPYTIQHEEVIEIVRRLRNAIKEVDRMRKTL
ncbi:putative aminotransferase [Pseudocercospora fuligena]|uniref:Putative aminotransferase n=1 Tax=Pseudocercospora fuligena TaxID=685502 RepID=A0A8H6VN14_9PEZI|nr:putative aminotransferase [Pseudocercospora fuligena]